MKLKRLRIQIDSVDKRIVRLLNERAKISSRIGNLKLSSGQSVYSPEREREVLNKIKSLSRGPLNSNGLEAIYREIMSSSLSLSKAPKIAYLGPEATFTHLAAIKRFGSQVDYVSCNSITDVFNEVEKGLADYGVVPIENSIEGAVTHTMDMLVDSDLKICAQVVLYVSHSLLANCTLRQVKKVYSKDQVFGQCRLWLHEHLSHAEKIDVLSTTQAAQIASREKNSACIASLLAAKEYKLKVLSKDIEDSPHNITRFLVIGKAEAKETGSDRTSVVFSIKDKVGALLDMLLPFRKYGINLTKIESRPSKKRAWDYYFFVDLKGHKDNQKVRKALTELENKCKFLKILGSYPVGE